MAGWSTTTAGRSTPTAHSRTSTDGDAEGEHDYYFNTYRGETELTVAVDLPGVAVESLTAGIDDRSNELVVAVEGATVGRVAIPWDRFSVPVCTFTNGILEVVLRATDDDQRSYRGS